MNIAEILAARDPVDGGFRTTIPDNWLQGRTAYGGLSAALAYEAARVADEDLPPLRSAQVSFVGPLSGPVTVTAKVERRGKNAAFVSARVTSELGLGLSCMFVFMRAMESHIEVVEQALDVTPPEEAADMDAIFESGQAPGFLINFETGPFDFAEQKADIVRWLRAKHRQTLDPMTELMLIGDGLPPAAMSLMQKAVPISSITWIYNILTPTPQIGSGWFRLRASSDHIEHGTTSQDMSVWTEDGQLVARGMQSIALFG
ncbi:MAG: thioesterase family protein [Pacificimonas sp.]